MNTSKTEQEGGCLGNKRSDLEMEWRHREKERCGWRLGSSRKRAGGGGGEGGREGKVKVSSAKRLIDVREWVCHFDASHRGLQQETRTFQLALEPDVCLAAWMMMVSRYEPQPLPQPAAQTPAAHAQADGL